MVEMKEMAFIVQVLSRHHHLKTSSNSCYQNATNHSLVIIDELGALFKIAHKG